MRAIVIDRPGGPDVLVEQQVPVPVPGENDVLIAVVAAGVNRADIGQRQGTYPPPPGTVEWPGLEVSGTVRAVGGRVTEWSVGDAVCALLPGGGYADLVVADAGQVLPVPEGVDPVDAAALPEAVATAWSNLVMLGGMRAGDTVLVHGGSSGVGTIAIQLASALGCRVAVTAGSAEKLAACEELGADILIDYRRQDFVERMLTATDRRGADVILDPIGGEYLARDLAALAPRGRVLVIGNQSGSEASIPVGALMGRWASIHGTTLRARPAAEKNEIIASVRENVWPLVSAGRIRPVIDSRFALAHARLAHERMESSAHIGKLVLLP